VKKIVKLALSMHPINSFEEYCFADKGGGF
jgi:hypothetical protein